MPLGYFDDDFEQRFLTAMGQPQPSLVQYPPTDAPLVDTPPVQDIGATVPAQAEAAPALPSFPEPVTQLPSQAAPTLTPTPAAPDYQSPAPGESKVVLPWEADATSSAAPTPPADAVAPGTVTGKLLEPENPYTGVNSPDAGEQFAARKDMYEKDPDAYMRFALDEQQDSARRQEEARQEAESSEAAKFAKKQAVVDQARAAADSAQQQYMADEKEVSALKVDPEKWWHDRSTGQKVAGYISAILGGLTQHLNGGRNIGLEAINNAIDQDVDAQKFNLQNRRAGVERQHGIVADLYNRWGDLDRATEAARVVSKENAYEELKNRFSSYDQAGTIAKAALSDYIKGRAAAQEYRDKRVQQAFKNQLEAGELAIKSDAQQLARQKAVAEEARRAGAGKVTKLEDIPLSAEQLRSMGVAIPENVNLPPMTIGQAKKVAETAKSVEDWQKAARDNSPEERNRQFAVGGVVDDQGNPVQFRNPDAAAKVSKAVSSADLSVQLIDRLITARQKYGWSSDLMKSPEWREMQSDFAQLILEKKNLDELGVIAGPDMDLMQKAIGTKDPTELRDPTPGLDRIRRTTVQKTNTMLRSEAVLPKGRSIKPFEPPKPPAAAPATPEDVSLKEALAFDPLRSGDPAAEFGLDLSRKTGGEQKSAIDEAFRANEGLLPSVRSTIDRLASVVANAETPEKDREKAASDLQTLATKAEDQAVRAYALRASTPNPAASAQFSKD